jgi:hypothetical protein
MTFMLFLKSSYLILTYIAYFISVEKQFKRGALYSSNAFVR